MSFLLYQIATLFALFGVPYLGIKLIESKIDNKGLDVNNCPNYALERYERSVELTKQMNKELYGHEEPLEYLFVEQLKKEDREKGFDV